MKIKYVTGNWAKILSARQILEPLGFEIEQIKMDTPEIQNDSIEEVSKYSAKWASEYLKCTVLKNDSETKNELRTFATKNYTAQIIYPKLEETINLDEDAKESAISLPLQ